MKQKKVRRLGKKLRGQAMVEMALILPVFLLLLFGVVEMARVGNAFLTVSNAARSATRVASLGGTDSEIRTAVFNASPTIDTASLTITIIPGESLRHSGQNVSVKVSYPVQLFIPVVSSIISNPVIVSDELNMRLE